MRFINVGEYSTYLGYENWKFKKKKIKCSIDNHDISRTRTETEPEFKFVIKLISIMTIYLLN